MEMKCEQNGNLVQVVEAYWWTGDDEIVQWCADVDVLVVEENDDGIACGLLMNAEATKCETCR